MIYIFTMNYIFFKKKKKYFILRQSIMYTWKPKLCNNNPSISCTAYPLKVVGVISEVNSEQVASLSQG